jgi:hypothetical protein
MVIIMIPPEELAEQVITEENRPDLIIHDLRQLLDVFPALTPQPVEEEKVPQES